MLNLLFNTLLTIIPHNTQKRRRRKERTTYGPLRRYSRWVTHPVRNPDRQGCLEYPSRRNDHNASDSNLLFLCLLLSVLPSLFLLLRGFLLTSSPSLFTLNLKSAFSRGFSFRKLQIFSSFRFAPFRFANHSKPLLSTRRRAFTGAPNGNFRENICSEDDLRTRIFGTFVVKFLACLPLLGFSNIYKTV